MKNIHVIPTDKPSRLVKIKDNLCYTTTENIPGGVYQHMYITSDEEIKEGDYSFYLPFGVGKNIVIDGELCFHIEAKDGKGSFTQRTYQTLDRNKKIILTTDQSLNGVQAIDDEFLEWFVENPTCEEAEVFHQLHKDEPLYKIIIPKEEPKQIKCYCGHTIYCDCGPLEEPKQERVCNCGLKESEHNVRHPFIPRQETLEESFSNYVNERYHFPIRDSYPDLESAKFGAKWMQERMYSEEEVKKICKTLMLLANDSNGIGRLEKFIEEWFDQFKKQ